MIEATIKNHRQSPRKVRVVADLVRGKKVSHALNVLGVLNKRASDPIRGAIQAAVANAKHNFRLEPDRLFVKEIRIDEGVTLKRHMPRAHGSAAPINKRSSHIFVSLDTKGEEILPSPKHGEKKVVEVEAHEEMEHQHA